MADFDETTETYSTLLSNTPVSIRIQVKDDILPGEVEQLVLEVTSALLTELGTGQPREVVVANSITLVIRDNDGK